MRRHLLQLGIFWLFCQSAQAELHLSCKKAHEPQYRQAFNLEVAIGLEDRLLELIAEFEAKQVRSPNPNSAEWILLRGEIDAIKDPLEELTSQILSSEDFDLGSSHLTIAKRMNELQGRLRVSPQNSLSKEIKERTSFTDLIESPGALKPESTYFLDQVLDVNGSERHEPRSVEFSQEIVDFFAQRAGAASLYFRAIKQGYVGPFAGAGIMRIPDIHPDLVEVKWPNGSEGNYRLMGCRHKAGHLVLLRVHKKRNGGQAGSLAIFRHLCS